MLHFATLFDKNYLSRGEALRASLRQHCKAEPFTFYVLALDDFTVEYYSEKQFPKVQVIALDEVEAAYPELLTVKPNRNRAEYCFTLSPYWPLYLLTKFGHIHQITTLDSDLYFFADPVLIFNNYKNASVLITPHNFVDEMKSSEKYGYFNVSFQSFKRNDDAMECLLDWKQQCFEWCYDWFDEENDRYADQKYLNTWQQKFRNVEVINLPGAGVAHWNVGNYSIKSKNMSFTINDEPLIYFHYQSVHRFGNYFATHRALNPYQKNLSRLYQIYLIELKKLDVWIKQTDANIQRQHLGHRSVLHKLFNTEGCWFYTRLFIYHLNLKKTAPAIRQIFFALKIRRPIKS